MLVNGAWGEILIWRYDPNLFATTCYRLNGAKSSADKILTTKLDTFSSNIISLLKLGTRFIVWDIIFKMSPRDLARYFITIMTSSNGNIFCVTGHLCGEFTVPGEFPAERPVTRSFDLFFDLRLNKRLSKQSWDWWFETLSCPLWRNCNAITISLNFRPPMVVANKWS